MEYMEDVIEKDPMAAYPPGRDDIPLLTGDRLIDSWERELAKGGTPDIEAAFADDADVQAWLKPKKNGDPAPDPIELEFSDNFTRGFNGKP